MGRCGPKTEPIAKPGDAYAEMRAQMVTEQIAGRGITTERVLAAMRKVPRHEFVPLHLRGRAYADSPLPIGHQQTISQPYIVAVMADLAMLGPAARVLEIGTGSGYQTAVLAELAADVYSVEIVEPLGQRAALDLQRLAYRRVHLRIGDGYRGWPEAAPFDAILVAAAPPKVPAPLLEQLAADGRLVLPVGDVEQELRVLVRTEAGIAERTVFPVRFVPMTGRVQDIDPER